MSLEGGTDVDYNAAGRATADTESPASHGQYMDRPNRWDGAASTWRTFTEEDRQTHAALTAVRDRNLSVHLYNAFALKRPDLLSANRLPNPGVSFKSDI